MIWIESCRDMTEEEIARETDKCFDRIVEASKKFKETLDDIQKSNTIIEDYIAESEKSMSNFISTLDCTAR